MFFLQAFLKAQLSLLALAVGLSLNVELVRWDGMQTAFSVGHGSHTLNLVHLESFQSATQDESEKMMRRHYQATLNFHQTTF